MSMQLGIPGSGGVKHSVLQFPPYWGAVSSTMLVPLSRCQYAACQSPAGPAPSMQLSLFMGGLAAGGQVDLSERALACWRSCDAWPA